ncbi:MAG TPA: hypothetical protein DEZ08_02015 [Dehalococcoidia bacterium]|nr:hypothetical protein [Dehalococcoidia bacterium]|tara:strand:+ start:679 stop:1317 length:639 start_codon:yes stop_codon:yes gene_type:complete
MKHSHIKFPANNLNFEGILSMPEDLNNHPSIVMCHPHPQNGGNMDNNVISSTALDLCDVGFVTLRFNFRGVGNSEGHFTNGTQEYQEILGALNFVKNLDNTNSDKTSLLGYSFGSRVILSQECVVESIAGIVLISPQTQALIESNVINRTVPILVVTGSNDHVCDSEQLSQFFEGRKEPTTLKIIEGADHFWTGKEIELRDAIRNFMVNLVQ